MKLRVTSKHPFLKKGQIVDLKEPKETIFDEEEDCKAVAWIIGGIAHKVEWYEPVYARPEKGTAYYSIHMDETGVHANMKHFGDDPNDNRLFEEGNFYLNHSDIQKRVKFLRQNISLFQIPFLDQIKKR